MTHFSKGVDYYLQGNTQYAFIELNKAIKSAPNHVRAYIYRGKTNQLVKLCQLAHKDFDKAIEIDPNSVQAFKQRASLYQKQKKFTQAINDYSMIIEISPDQEIGYIGRATIQYHLKKYTEALEDCTNAIHVNSKSSKAFFLRGACQQKLKKYKEAQVDYSKAISFDHQFQLAYYKRGEVDEELQDYEKAIMNYDQLIALDNNSEVGYYKRGNIYRIMKDFQKAQKDYLMTIQLFPQSIPYLINLAQFYISMGQTTKAKFYAEQAICQFQASDNQLLKNQFEISLKYIIDIKEFIFNYQHRKYQIDEMKLRAEKQKNSQVLEKLKHDAELNQKQFIEEINALCKLKVNFMPSCPYLIKEYSHQSDEISKLPGHLPFKLAANFHSNKQTLRTKQSRKGSMEELQDWKQLENQLRQRNGQEKKGNMHGCCNKDQCLIY